MKSKPAYLTLLLALLHGVAGITILVISSWFIAISAIAPVGFTTSHSIWVCQYVGGAQ